MTRGRSRKREIEIRAESGLAVDARDVVRVSRCKGVVTFRHVWPGNVDGRVWDGVKRAAMRLAQEVADTTGRSVGLYAAEGYMVENVEPEPRTP